LDAGQLVHDLSHGVQIGAICLTIVRGRGGLQ
jgi:hypothetical protein